MADCNNKKATKFFTSFSIKEYDCELRMANARYIKEAKANLKAHKLEQLNKSVEGKALNFIEKLVYNLKKLKIHFSL